MRELAIDTAIIFALSVIVSWVFSRLAIPLLTVLIKFKERGNRFKSYGFLALVNGLKKKSRRLAGRAYLSGAPITIFVSTLLFALGIVSLFFLTIKEYQGRPDLVLIPAIAFAGLLLGFLCRKLVRNWVVNYAFRFDKYYCRTPKIKLMINLIVPITVYISSLTFFAITLRYGSPLMIGLSLGTASSLIISYYLGYLHDLSRAKFIACYYCDISRREKRMLTKVRTPREKIIRDLINNGHLQLALFLLNASSKQIPERETYVLMGRIYFMQEDYVNLMMLFHRVIDLGIDSSRLAYLYSRGLYNIGELDEMYRFIKPKVEDTSRLANSYLWVNYGLYWIGVGKFAEARKCENKALLLDKTCLLAKAFKSLAIALSCRLVFKLKGERRQKTRRSLRFALNLINESIEMQKELAKSKAIPKDVFLREKDMFNDIKGYILYKLDKIEDAFDVLVKCVKRDPRYAWPYFHLGLIFEKYEEFAIARNCYGRILHITRNWPKSVIYRLTEQRLKKISSVIHSNNLMKV